MLLGHLLKDGYGDYAVLQCLHFQRALEVRSVKHSLHTVGAAGRASWSGSQSQGLREGTSAAANRPRAPVH